MIELLQVINIMMQNGFTETDIRDAFDELDQSGMDVEVFMNQAGCAPKNAQALLNFERALPKLESAIVISLLKAEGKV